MGQLTNQYVSQSYQGLLKLQDSTTGVTSTLQYVQDGVGNNIPIQVSTSSVVITGSFRGDGSGLTGVTAIIDSGSLVTTSSFNAYTSSNDSKVNSLISQTGSYVTETESGSFVTNVQQGIIPSIVMVTKGNGTTSQFTIDNVVSSSFAQNALSASYAPTILPSGVISGSQQIADLGYATTSSVTSLSQSIAVTDLAQDGRLTSLETFTGSINTGYVSETEFGTYTSSMNNFTTSIDGRVDALEIATGSLQNQINQKLDTGSFNTYTSSQAVYNNFLVDLISTKVDTGSFNSYTSSNDGKVNSLISATGSYATTGSNTFIGTQTINGQLQVSDIAPSVGSDISIVASNVNVTGSLNVTNEITALSASITYLQTIYQTSSVIFTSGSNILGDEPSDVQTLNGRVDIPLGNLNVTGSTTSSLGFFGNLQGTASFASNALSSSHSVNADTASYVLNAVSSSYSDFALSSSFAQNALSSSHAINADNSISSSQAQNAVSASYSLNSTSASFAQTSISSSFSNFAVSSSQAQNAVSASYALSSSFSDNATNASDIRVYVKNVTGTQIDKGKIVRITGATGDNALIALASFEDDNNSANTLGWTGENIPNDAFGWVYTQGTLLGVNTSGYTPGQILYLSSSGNFTGTIPPAPYHEVRLGQVLRVQQNNGSVYVSIQNGYELEELHDVDIISPVVGDVLTYVSGSYGQWENKTVAELGYLQTSSFNTYTGDTLNVINQKLDTGSFNSYTSSTNGRLDSIESKTGSYATTGSNVFRGNQTITGSVNVSGNTINNTNGVNTQYFGSSFGGNVGVFNVSNNTEVGLALDGNDWTTNWSTGPILYVNNTAGDTYEAVFGFQNKANYTDGRVTVVKPIVFNAGATGSLQGTASFATQALSASYAPQDPLPAGLVSGSAQISYTGITDVPSGIISGSGQLTGFGFATTGSNTFIGNQVITGSVLISGSAVNDLRVVGQIVSTGSALINTDNVNIQYLGSTFGGSIGITKLSDNTEVGLALDGAQWTTNWSNGPLLYVNNTPGDTYEGVFGFQNKTNYTDGRITALKPMVFNAGVTGSFNVTGSTTFSGNNGFPVNVDGTISSKRFSFVGNPFNSNLGGTFGSLKFDGNNTRLEYVNNDLGTPATKSAVYLTTNTGSNFTAVENQAEYAGSIASTLLTNTSGTRTFNVNVDSSAFTGSLGVTGDITSNNTLVSAYSAGDEGGEIRLALPATNTTLTSSVTIDMNQNRLRIFESGGTNRGGYFDISSLAPGVGTNLVGGGGSAFPYVGTAIITGSLVITGSAGASVNATNGILTQYFGNSFGGNIGINKNSDFTEVGLALDGASWGSNWSTGPLLYVNNNPGDTYDGVFGFQDKTNFTDGRVTVLKPMVFNAGVTGSFSVTGATTFQGNNDFPVNVVGTLTSKRIIFGGNPFNSTFGGTLGSLNYDGNNTRLEYINADFGTPQTSSYSYLTTNTGSNVTTVENGANYGGTTAKTVVSNNNGTRTFEVDVNRTTITGSVQGNVNALSISSNTASLNLNDGNFFTLQLVSGSATHINPSNIKPGQTVNILLNTTGSGTVNFPSSVKQISGSAYVPTTTTGTDIITLVSFDSTNLYLANVKNLV